MNVLFCLCGYVFYIFVQNSALVRLSKLPAFKNILNEVKNNPVSEFWSWVRVADIHIKNGSFVDIVQCECTTLHDSSV